MLCFAVQYSRPTERDKRFLQICDYSAHYIKIFMWCFHQSNKCMCVSVCSHFSWRQQPHKHTPHHICKLSKPPSPCLMCKCSQPCSFHSLKQTYSIHPHLDRYTKTWTHTHAETCKTYGMLSRSWFEDEGSGRECLISLLSPTLTHSD